MRNEPRHFAPVWRLVLACFALALPWRAFAIPGDVLFSDNFERANLAPWTTTNGARAGILAGASVSNSPTRGAFTRRNTVTVTSPTIAAAVPAATVSIWVRRGSDAFSENPDSGEDFFVEYQRADGTWGQLMSYPGSDAPGQIFTDTFVLPPDGLHGSLALRVRQSAGSNGNFDWWHFDDVVVTEIAPPAATLALGVCDDFEGGFGSNWTITATSGIAGVSDMTSQSPNFSMTTNAGVVDVTSIAVDTSDPSFGDLSMWIRRGSDAFSEFPDATENFVVEYLNDVGAWVILETFTGGGAAGQIFLRNYPIPVAGRHANFQLRFRQTGGSGPQWDFWHVDDVCFNQQALPDLLVTKSVQTLSDPINGTSNPKAIPGAVVQYTVSVSNQGAGGVDAGTMVVTDVVPNDGALFVDTTAGDPIAFSDGPVASGLSYTYASDVSFSNQVGGGPPYTYTPVPDADGYDSAITGFRIGPSGPVNPASAGNTPSFSFLMTVRVQ